MDSFTLSLGCPSLTRHLSLPPILPLSSPLPSTHSLHSPSRSFPLSLLTFLLDDPLVPIFPSVARIDQTAKKIPLDTLAGAGRAGAKTGPNAGGSSAAGAAAAGGSASGGSNVKLGEDGAKKEACAC